MGRREVDHLGNHSVTKKKSKSHASRDSEPSLPGSRRKSKTLTKSNKTRGFKNFVSKSKFWKRYSKGTVTIQGRQVGGRFRGHSSSDGEMEWQPESEVSFPEPLMHSLESQGKEAASKNLQSPQTHASGLRHTSIRPKESKEKGTAEDVHQQALDVCTTEVDSRMSNP